MVTDAARLEPGSAAWRQWLDETQQKAFRFVATNGSFSGRRETKAERSYWYAYRKSGGRLRKAYLGRSEDLSLERLEAIAAQLATESATPQGTVPATAQGVDLPRPANALIGRERQIADLTTLLVRDDVRLVSLTGPGGTGKTRLAIATAQALTPHFRDGVWFIDLSAIDTPELVVREIARHLAIQDVGEVPVRERLHHHLAKAHALLVLDNMEQVLVAASEVADLLDACRALHLLVTSREPLHLESELRYPVPPLDVPDLSAPFVLESVRDAPAVNLFLLRAQAAGAVIDVTPQTAHDLAELCVRLDGLPLAIELAAARARLLRPRDMLARIARQMDLLRGEDEDRPARHQSLRAAIGWSYDLLNEAEQRALRWLAVFSGGCTLEAAEAVLDSANGLDLFASLLDKNLVRSEPGPLGETRLTMLESIRAFGLEQLSASGEDQTARLRHGRYYLSLVRPSSWIALDLPSTEWLDMVAPEHDNMRAALRWSLEQGETRLGLELAASLQVFWIVGGYLSEGLAWMRQAMERGKGLDAEVEAVMHHGAGQLAWRQGDYDAAARHYSAGLALRRALGDTFGSAVSLQGLASVARDRGDVDEAIVLWEQCVSVFRASGNRARTLRATLNLAIALHLAGQSERAATLLEGCVEEAHEIGQVWAEATALTYLGVIALEVWNDAGRAASYARDALPLAPRVSDAWVTVHLVELAAWLASGDDATLPNAAQLFAASEALRERIGARLHPAFLAGHARRFARVEDLEQDEAADALASDEVLRIARRIVRHVASRTAQRTVTDAAPDQLSARERQVALLVAQGLTSREIADRLILGERTVETHVDHIRAKLGVRSRAQIAAWAVERGLLSTER